MRISVITVSFNTEKTISDTILSTAFQTYENFEHIIVDGDSKDNTLSVIERNRHAKLRVISEPDAGLYDAMNKGVSLATGDLIGFLNADDFFLHPDVLQKLASGLPQEAAAVGGSVILVDPIDTSKIERFYRSKGFQPWMLRFGHMPPHPAFYARRSAFEAVGPFDIGLKIGADFEWMVRFFHGRRLGFSTVTDTLTAVRTGGLSNRGLSSRVQINKEALQSCRKWGLWTNEALMWSRYAFKSAQWFARPTDLRVDERLLQSSRQRQDGQKVLG
jgi:glycosyltransferase involved in cell wall biosynthesis